jgi:hypothetical protein
MLHDPNHFHRRYWARGDNVGYSDATDHAFKSTIALCEHDAITKDDDLCVTARGQMLFAFGLAGKIQQPVAFWPICDRPLKTTLSISELVP